MIDLVNERYEKDIAFHKQEIKKVKEKIDKIEVLAMQTNDDRLYNAIKKELEIRKESLKSSLKKFLNDYSIYKESVKEANKIF